MGTWKHAVTGMLAAAALSLCGLTAFAAPASAAPEQVTTPPPRVDFNLSATTLVVSTSGESGAFTTFHEAFASLSSSSDDVTIKVGTGFENKSDLIIDMPTDKGITSLRLEPLGEIGTSVGVSWGDTCLYANGIPITIGSGLTFNGTIYGGANGKNLSVPSTSIVVEAGGTAKIIYGGSFNGTLVGDTSIVVNGTATTVFGGGMASGTTLAPDAVADVQGSTHISLSTTGSVQNAYGGGNARPSVFTGEPTSAQANVTHSTHVTIDGKIKQTFGGGSAALSSASNAENQSVTANVGTNQEGAGTFIVFGESAAYPSDSMQNKVCGGGNATGNQYATNDVSADVIGNTSIEALLDNQTSSFVKSKTFFYIVGGGYSSKLSHANVEGGTSIKTARIALDSASGLVGGGMAVCGGTANVSNTSVEIFSIPGQSNEYTNACRVIGGGWAENFLANDPLSSSPTTATAKTTRVVIHDGINIDNETTPPVAFFGGGASRGNYCETSVEGSTAIEVLPNAKLITGVVGGGLVWGTNSGRSQSISNVGSSKISVGDNASVANITGGGYVQNGENATAKCGAIQIELGKGCSVTGLFVGGGYAHSKSEGCAANATSITTKLGENATVKDRFIGAGYAQNTTSSSAAVEGDVRTSVGNGATLSGASTAGGGFTWQATDSSVDVGGNVATSFGDHVKTQSFAGGGMPYYESKSCTANIAGSIITTIGNDYTVTAGEFAGAGYPFYKTVACSAEAGSVATSFGDRASLKCVVGAGWARSGNSDSADVAGAASITFGNNATFASDPSLIGGGKVEKSPGSHANVGSEFSQDAVLVSMGESASIKTYYGGGYVIGSEGEGTAGVTGSVKTNLAGGTIGTFNGGSCIQNLANGHADIDGSIESRLANFSFSASGEDYNAHVVGAGAVLGTNGPATISGNVATRLTNCTINGKGAGSSTSFPYVGGRLNSNVVGDAELILDNAQLVNQDVYVTKGWMGAIGGTSRIVLVGNLETDRTIYATRTVGAAEVVVGDGISPANIAVDSVRGGVGNGTTNVVVKQQAIFEVSGIADHLKDIDSITVEDGGTVRVVNATAPAAIRGNLTGGGTVSLPAGGSIAGEGNLDGSLTLLVDGTLAGGQTYFDFSNRSAGSVAFEDQNGAFTLVKDTSTEARTKWIMRELHTVTFDVDGGTPAPNPAKVADGEKIPAPAEPVKEHYAFGGWFSDELCTQPYTFDVPVTSDLTLYAKWTPLDYTVTFDLGHDSQSITQTVTYGKAATEPAPAPTREGFHFDGWFADASRTQKYDFSSLITGDLTLYAKWTTLSYTVAFDVNGGTPEPNPQVIKHGKTAQQPETPTRAGRMFAGWYASADFSGDAWDFDRDLVTTDLTLHAKWADGIKIAVETVGNGSIDPSDAEIIYTGTPVELRIAPDYGYKIGSVTINGVPAAYSKAGLREGALTLSPSEAITVKVTFVQLDTDTAGDIINDLPTIDPQDTPEVVDQKKDEVFDAKLDYESMTPEQKVNLDQAAVDKLNDAVAKVPEVEIKVELKINAGVDANVAIPAGQEARFIGAVGKSDIAALKNGDATLLKVLVQIQNVDAPSEAGEDEALAGVLGTNKIGQHFATNVTKELSNGDTTLASEPITSLPAPVQLTFDVPKTLLDVAPGTTREFAMTRTHHNGAQWQAQLLDDEDGNARDETIVVSTDRFSTYTIVYADTHAVTFETNGGSDVDSQVVADGALAKESVAPVRSGYEFDGWFADAACTQAWSFATPVTGPLTLYAKWTRLFKVTFEVDGGSAVSPMTVRDGSKIDAPAEPKKDNFTFEGWFADQALTKPWDFATDTVTSDITLFAKWLEIVDPYPNSYEVAFVTGDGASKVEPQTVTDGDLASEPAAPTRAGYEFGGWFADEACAQPWDFNAPVTGPLTLYAKWTKVAPPEPAKHRVTFEVNGGSPAPAAQEVVDGGFVVRPSVNPEREGYMFAGWFADAGLTSAWDFDESVVASDLTLYAKWTKNEVPEPGPGPEPDDGTGGVPGPDDPSDQGGDQPVKPLAPAGSDAKALAPTGDVLVGGTTLLALACGVAFIAAAIALKRRCA